MYRGKQKSKHAEAGTQDTLLGRADDASRRRKEKLAKAILNGRKERRGEDRKKGERGGA